jgi:hypothetical protein
MIVLTVPLGPRSTIRASAPASGPSDDPSADSTPHPRGIRSASQATACSVREVSGFRLFAEDIKFEISCVTFLFQGLCR